MNDLQVFNFNSNEVRTTLINNEVYFVGKDVAEVLGYERPDNAIRNHIDSEDKLMHQISASGQNREMVLINESGLYSLVLSSKLPQAKAFKHWVTSDVLPNIRKHGMYAKDELLNDPDLFIKVLQEYKEERNKRIELEAKNKELQPKALFAECVSASNTSILIGELAKLISQNGVEIGQNRLFQWLRDNNFLIKSGSSKNMPTQKSMELGLMEIKERTINNNDGSIKIVKTPKVTGKGQVYFVTRFCL